MFYAVKKEWSLKQNIYEQLVGDIMSGRGVKLHKESASKILLLFWSEVHGLQKTDENYYRIIMQPLDIYVYKV